MSFKNTQFLKIQSDEKPSTGPLQYAAQVPELHNLGIATVAFDYLGCGRSEKPDIFTAYSAHELYQDLVAVFHRYTKVRLEANHVCHIFY